MIGKTVYWVGVVSPYHVIQGKQAALGDHVMPRGCVTLLVQGVPQHVGPTSSVALDSDFHTL